MKKNILIPYEKYEKLINQSKMDNSDMTDGQCVSHTQHIELSRDKTNEYGFNYEKDKEEERNANLSLGLQKGEGGFQFNANAELNRSPPLEPGFSNGGGDGRLEQASSNIRLSPKGRQAYITQAGPPGRRQTGPPGRRQTTNRKKKWQTF